MHSRCCYVLPLYAFSTCLFLVNLYQLLSYNPTVQTDERPSFAEDKIISQLSLTPAPNSSNEDTKLILLPNGYPPHVYPERLTFLRDKCPFSMCALTDNPKNLERADAVVFQGDFNPNFAQPYKRPPRQIWIYYQLESPIHTQPLGKYSSLFNWTATYRMDSTIVTPYAKLVRRPALRNSTLLRTNRTNLAACFMSNCDTTNHRWNYIKELQKYVQVDVYGTCGPLVCTRHNEHDCQKMLREKYKFYLAFENSNCIDYISEKFFQNALR
jgi:glycoprotein 3-alpha-L-fucosyltransferase